MECTIAALLTALKLTFAQTPEVHRWPTIATSDCSKCKCPQSEADTMECAAEEATKAARTQRQWESDREEIVKLIRVCEAGR